jgi:hypothetical protein
MPVRALRKRRGHLRDASRNAPRHRCGGASLHGADGRGCFASPRSSSWCLARFSCLATWPIVVQSAQHLEAFPDTFNPGYFVIKAAVALLAVLVLLQAVSDCVRGPAPMRD